MSWKRSALRLLLVEAGGRGHKQIDAGRSGKGVSPGAFVEEPALPTPSF